MVAAIVTVNITIPVGSLNRGSPNMVSYLIWAAKNKWLEKKQQQKFISHILEAGMLTVKFPPDLVSAEGPTF
jgi:hypothetical protein